MNLLDFINNQHPDRQVIIYSTSISDVHSTKFQIDQSNIVIKRLARIGKGQNAASRYFNYFLFYTVCFISLLIIRPKAILYYETLSSFPVWLFKKFIAPMVPVFIHYHEYVSPGEYNSGMRLGRFFHKKEKWLYDHSAWISHTNTERLQLFLKDEGVNGNTSVSVLPNYPSKKWNYRKQSQAKLPLRIIYVGALSINTMYTTQFANWVLQQKGKVIWDIYSNNLDEPAREYLQGLNAELIRLHAGVSYQQLPEILKKFDVGIILYNGHIPNYIFNAPNKLFEYLACGLDVWFPTVMKGCMPYVTNGTFPKVVPFNFSEPDNFEFEAAINKIGLNFKASEFYYENILSTLTNALFKNSC
jgi:hypothetical protein